MKQRIFLFALFLSITNLNYAKNEIVENDNPLKILNFNYISEVDFDGLVEKEWVQEQKVYIYAITMKNSTDKLLAIQNKDENELKPFAFVEINNGQLFYKDINNRKKVLEINKVGDEIKLTYFENNDSKEGLALTKKGCLGQDSTLGCYKYAKESCETDLGCYVMCEVSGWRCDVAILAACAVSCNKEPEITEEE